MQALFELWLKSIEDEDFFIWKIKVKKEGVYIFVLLA